MATKIELTIRTWHRDGKITSNVEPFYGNFHAGTTYRGYIELDTEEEEDLRNQINDGYEPVLTLEVKEIYSPRERQSLRERIEIANLTYCLPSKRDCC